MPENTIPAMLKAIDLDVTTLEMDVVISGDKQVVVSHDPTFNPKITTTPEGKFLPAEEAAHRRLYSMPYDSIRKYDVGLKPHPDYPQQQKLAVGKPLLSELFAACEAHAAKAGKQMRFNVEIKSLPTGDGINHPVPEEFVDLVMAVVRAAGVSDRTNIQSFDPRVLQVMHRRYPESSLALLIEDDDKRPLSAQLTELGFVPPIYSPHYSLINDETMKQCRAKGMKVIPWTVNTLEEMKRQLAFGVDGIITDYPDLFARL